MILSLGNWGCFDVTGLDEEPWIFGKVAVKKWTLFLIEDWECEPGVGL